MTKTLFPILDAFRESTLAYQDGHILTRHFLYAFANLPSFFHVIGSPCLAALLQREISKRTKLVERVAAERATRTLKELLALENSKSSAREALLWIQRVMWFVESLLRTITSDINSDEHKPISAAALSSYQRSKLRESHSVVTRAIFERALTYLPTWADFCECIENDMTALNAITTEIERHVTALNSCLQEGV
jgi:hypothetical protein